jgi:hypothetical protein
VLLLLLLLLLLLKVPLHLAVKGAGVAVAVVSCERKKARSPINLFLSVLHRWPHRKGSENLSEEAIHSLG